VTLAETQARLFAAITRPDVVPASTGLEISRNAYRERLVSTLRQMFPALLHALGEELFIDFADAFIDAEPPRGTTLERLATEFPRHLEATAPDEPWARFVIELAQLESAFREVFDGPVSSREFRFAYPVGEYLEAVRRGEEPELPQARETCVTMRRVGYRVVLI